MIRDKKILIIISQRNFCDEEYHKSLAVFDSFGIRCHIASSELSTAVGMEGSFVNPGFILKKIKTNEYEAICFIGGVGCTEYWHNKEVHNLAVRACKAGILMGAICLAPVILANAGLLKGKRATAYPSAEGYMKKKGALYSGYAVETDKNIVTAKDPEAAEAFALKMCGMLEQGTV